ncbi:MAG: hypothetical protein M3Z21_07280, partial [Pseudomonadota bacterium]|nr:hypothetical protein [Pseudomonadota bacterium]
PYIQTPQEVEQLRRRRMMAGAAVVVAAALALWLTHLYWRPVDLLWADVQAFWEQGYQRVALLFAGA